MTDISDVIQSPLIFYVYNNTIFFELGTMAVGQSTNLTFSAVVTAGGATATNAISSASISSTDFDQNLSNNTASAINPISGEDVTLRLTGSPGTVEFGQPITYTVIMTNLGPSTSSGHRRLQYFQRIWTTSRSFQCPEHILHQRPGDPVQ